MCGPPHYNEHNDLFEYNPHVLKRVLTYIFYFIILVAFTALYGKLSWLILKATITSKNHQIRLPGTNKSKKN